MKSVWAFAAVLAAASCGPAFAQDAPPAVAQPEAPLLLTLPAGTIVDIEVAEKLGSNTHLRGDKFAIRLAGPIATESGVLVPAGASGVGEVISAAKAGMLGKAGELLLAARYIEYDGQRIPLRTFRLGDAGQDNTAVVLAASLVIPLAFVIKGGDIEIPAGTRANAKLAADLSLPAVAAQPTPEPPQITPEQENPQ